LKDNCIIQSHGGLEFNGTFNTI